MKECRHPNICLFIGLSRAPPPDNRIFIISEFIDNGNVRLYIHDKSRPFPWRLRLSFATDIARALAYLHARKCIHRDLKGENLLVTANGRIKITDFGFARIAARNEEESKRLTFCGTDAYMSPEILLGDEFDLPTDVFSLGIIFCEISARKLADETAFKRYPPDFGINLDEVHEMVSTGCPKDFIQLCIDCLHTDPSKRPTTRDILARLRVIEAEVLLRPNEGDDTHVGSVKFLTGVKRPGAGPRIPSFGMGVGKLVEAVVALSKVGVKDKEDSHWSTISDISHEPLLNGTVSEYSTTVIRGHSQQGTATIPPSLSSILTIRPSLDGNAVPDPVLPATSPLTPEGPSPSNSPDTSSVLHPPQHTHELSYNTSSALSIGSMDTYHTVPDSGSSFISSALATEGGSTIRSLHDAQLLVHRFTLLKPGAKPKKASGNASPQFAEGSWNPLDLFFSSGLLVTKCDLCTKRIGWKPVLECDDCGLRCASSVYSCEIIQVY
ncbi:kinase-like domain-containing protein [Cyathus striatus]|nr:kinase-like domain-containing protein [Cyathus striatus]